MKNLLIMLFTLLSLSGFSQQVKITMYKGTGATYSTITSQTNDSITNTETTYFYTRAGALNKYTSGAFTVNFVADTTSGTPTTIHVIQQGSFDGVTWFRLNGEALGVDGRNADSLSITTAANTTFTLSTLPKSSKFIYGGTRGSFAVPVPYFRLMFVAPSGTHNTVISNVKISPFQL